MSPAITIMAIPFLLVQATSIKETITKRTTAAFSGESSKHLLKNQETHEQNKIEEKESDSESKQQYIIDNDE